MFLPDKEYSTEPEILENFENKNTRPGLVKDDNAVVASNGRKYIKAGTPVGADKPFYADPNHVVLTPVTDGTAQGIVYHTVDVTDGTASAVIIRRGDVVIGNMEAEIQKLYTDDVVKALTNVTLN